MTTHEYARQLLEDIDCPLDWPVCRACGKRMKRGSGINYGATSIMECCAQFHAKCYKELTPKQLAEANLSGSKLFKAY